MSTHKRFGERFRVVNVLSVRKKGKTLVNNSHRPHGGGPVCSPYLTVNLPSPSSLPLDVFLCLFSTLLHRELVFQSESFLYFECMK